MENKDMKVLPSAMKSVDWPAIFAGLVFVIAANWLLFLLGAALGMSIADGSDMAALGDGLGIASIIWIIVSGIVTYFAAGYMTTRLARNVDEQQGTLQALTLWSSAVVVTVVLGAMGVGGVVSAGSSVISKAGSITSSLASGGASAVESMAKNVNFDKVGQNIKQEVAQYAAKNESGDVLSERDAKKAMEQLDQDSLEQIAGRLVDGDTAGAKKVFRDETDLNEKQIKSLMTGLKDTIESNSDIKSVQGAVRNQYADVTNSAAKAAGPEISGGEIRTAIDQLDKPTLMDIGRSLISGDTKAAKATLTQNTTLSDKEVEAVVNEVSDAYEEQIEDFKEAVDTASSYATGMAWALFLATLLSLAAAIFGGRKGVDSIRKRFPDHVASVTRS